MDGNVQHIHIHSTSYCQCKLLMIKVKCHIYDVVRGTQGHFVDGQLPFSFNQQALRA